MAYYVGLDVSLEETSICAIDENGDTVWQGKTSSKPEAIAKAIASKAPEAAEIGFETGPLSTWHWHSFKEMGLPVVCLDARHAKAALSMQVNKTDANDAYGLAQIVRTGWYREVKVKSMDSHLTRTLLTSRSNLIELRTKLSTHLRGILKTFGLFVGKVWNGAFESRVRELSFGIVGLESIIEAQLAVWSSVCEQIKILERQIRAYARSDHVCRRLMTAPGVGAITALAFKAVIDDPKRFRKSTSVGAYLGLTPRRYQSGEVDKTGRISKCGDALMRCYLFEASNLILNRVRRWSRLKAWGTKLAKQFGSKKAKVALA